MKATAILFSFLFTASLFSQSNINQSLSVNSSGAAPDASAQLDVSATDKGMLVPRMTSAQRTAITAANALLVFDSDTRSFWFFDTPGATWREIRAGNVATLEDADGNTKVQLEETPNEDIIRMDLAGSERWVLQRNAAGKTQLSLPNSSHDIFIGENAGNGNSTGFSNIAIGKDALFLNTTRSNLVAVGDSALYNNGVGATLPFHSSGNTALGSKALFSNTIGDNNTASGHQALFSNTSGFVNTANGYLALQANQTGFANTASGARALLANTTGHTNTATGSLALTSNTSGNSNTGIGVEALKFNTTGNNNTAVGLGALVLNTVGNNNTAAGYAALNDNKANSRSTAFGYGAMWHADDRTTGRETFNTAVGYEALKGSATPADNTGQYNTAVGDQALYSNTSGFSNIANGYQALYSNTSGSSNAATGQQALYLNTTGGGNTANGYHALYANTTGGSNTVSGHEALYSNDTGNSNTVVGAQTMYFNTTGSGNTAQGHHALSTNATGNNNTAIGANADVLSNNLDNATAIGYNANVGCSNCLVLGGTGGNAVNVGIGTTTPTTAKLVIETANPGENGLDLSTADAYAEMRVIRNTLNGFDNDLYLGFGSPAGSATRLYSDGIETLTTINLGVGIGRNPVTNKLEVEGNASKSSAGDWLANSDARLKKNITPLDSREMLKKLLALRGVTYEWNDDKTGSERPEGIQYGFTAQNIQEVFPTLVEEDKLGYLQTAYGTYDAMTVEAIRALKMENEELRMENAALKAELHANKSQLEKITAALQGAGIAVEK